MAATFCIAGALGAVGLPPTPDVLLYTLPTRAGWYVLEAIFIYQLWGLAQPSDLKIKKPTPGRAIAYWFIPFFGLYWMFVMLTNLAKHMNHMNRMTGSSSRKIPVRLVTIGCGLFVAGMFTPLNPVRPTGVAMNVFLDLSGLAGVIILLINNFFFYRAARELCVLRGQSGAFVSGKGPAASNA